MNQLQSCVFLVTPIVCRRATGARKINKKGAREREHVLDDSMTGSLREGIEQHLTFQRPW